MDLSQIGPLLRQAREAAGLSLREASDKSNIPESYLEVFESGDPGAVDHGGVLANELYRRSFFRRYATELGFDSQWIEDALPPAHHSSSPSERVSVESVPVRPTFYGSASSAPPTRGSLFSGDRTEPFLGDTFSPGGRRKSPSTGGSALLLLALLLLAGGGVYLFIARDKLFPAPATESATNTPGPAVTQEPAAEPRPPEIPAVKLPEPTLPPSLQAPALELPALAAEPAEDFTAEPTEHPDQPHLTEELLKVEIPSTRPGTILPEVGLPKPGN